ncbi:hypothetical protein DM02DRAFT_301174 [Periconia macrospinosa]|uniref:Uncharacterized protein n=1 Tax=Periconia macrospinosa TaxID=97972 RepID=A0A2V1DWC0_9PLEO|nr:hypothetical protein DM02DRAFT_301174 [Periconia macrospinosa]
MAWGEGGGRDMVKGGSEKLEQVYEVRLVGSDSFMRIIPPCKLSECGARISCKCRLLFYYLFSFQCVSKIGFSNDSLSRRFERTGGMPYSNISFDFFMITPPTLRAFTVCCIPPSSLPQKMVAGRFLFCWIHHANLAPRLCGERKEQLPRSCAVERFFFFSFSILSLF